MRTSADDARNAISEMEKRICNLEDDIQTKDQRIWDLEEEVALLKRELEELENKDHIHQVEIDYAE